MMTGDDSPIHGSKVGSIISKYKPLKLIKSDLYKSQKLNSDILMPADSIISKIIVPNMGEITEKAQDEQSHKSPQVSRREFKPNNTTKN